MGSYGCEQQPAWAPHFFEDNMNPAQFLDFVKKTYNKPTAEYVEKMLINYCNILEGIEMNKLDSIVCQEPVAKDCWPIKKKKEDPMSSYASATVVNEASTEKDQRAYLRSRIRTIRADKNSALFRQFGLTDDEAPTTPGEFAKRIADGQYTIDKENLDKKTYSPAAYIRWRDPAKVEDKAGYEKAYEALTAAYTKAKDAAVLSPIADAKTALDTFESWTLS